MNDALVVLVEDDEDTQRVVRDFLKDLQCEVRAFSSGEKSWEYLRSAPSADCLLLDVRLPDLDGLQIFERVRELYPTLPIILITAYGNTHDAVEAMRQGAYYYFTKPIDFLLLRRTVAELLEKIRLQREVESLRSNTNDHCGFVGAHSLIRQALERVKSVADLPTTVLITGETGTGKELIARAIHNSGLRRLKPFLAVNCAALPENLLESELFGYERGAFTGATQSKPGKIELADHGSLFLDEVGDMPSVLQAKLLRVIETKVVERLGSIHDRQVNVRFIAATHRDLSRMVSEGQFRQDLYFRLNLFEIHLPSLRQRLDDLPLLTRYFLEQLNDAYRKEIDTIDPKVLDAFRRYNWPGNARELKHVLEAAVIVCTEKCLKMEHLPPRSAWSSQTEAPEQSSLSDMEKVAVVEALRRHEGNRSAAARELGITRNQIRHKIKKFGLDE